MGNRFFPIDILQFASFTSHSWQTFISFHFPFEAFHSSRDRIMYTQKKTELKRWCKQIQFQCFSYIFRCLSSSSVLQRNRIEISVTTREVVSKKETVLLVTFLPLTLIASDSRVCAMGYNEELCICFFVQPHCTYMHTQASEWRAVAVLCVFNAYRLLYYYYCCSCCCLLASCVPFTGYVFLSMVI